MGLCPVLIDPRTLVRTWGTRTELVGGEEWNDHAPFIPRGSAKPVVTPLRRAAYVVVASSA